MALQKRNLFKFIILIVCIVIPATLLMAASASDAAVKEKLQQLLDTTIKQHSIPGAVLLISSPTMHDIVIASGYSNLAAKSTMTTSNNFRIASMSKTFLAALVLKLAEQGKIKLDDTIAKLLPKTVDVHRIANANIVTVRELLQMRSGIPNYVDNIAYGAQIGKRQLWHPEDVIKLIYDEKSSFAPGNKYEYSNTNYVLLQMIVENATHTTLAQQLRKNIFNPLGLKETYQEAQDDRKGGYHGLLTHGYDQVNDKMSDVTSWNDVFGLGDGGIVSTAIDMKIFIHFLLNRKKLLKPSSLQQMLMFTDDYGLGISRDNIANQLVWTHSGRSSGFSGEYYYFPKSRVTIIVLTNSVESDVFSDIVKKSLQIIK